MSRSLLCFALVSCLASTTAAQDASIQVTRDRAGVLALGMTRDSVLRLVDHARVMDLMNCTEQGCQPVLGILRGTNVETPALLARLREGPCGTWHIESMEVLDPAFRTREGVGVGISRAELQRAYATTESAQERGELNVSTLGLRFRIARATRDGEARVEAIILRDPSTIRPAPPRCGAPTPSAPR